MDGSIRNEEKEDGERYMVMFVREWVIDRRLSSSSLCMPLVKNTNWMANSLIKNDEKEFWEKKTYSKAVKLTFLYRKDHLFYANSVWNRRKK